VAEEPGKYDARHWVYSAQYQRLHGSSWLNNAVRVVADGGKHGRTHMAGYDVCFYVHDWLSSDGFGDRSLVEVALTDPGWMDQKVHVSLATIFWFATRAK